MSAQTVRPHIEMEPVDLSSGWTALPGFPEGLEVKVLSDDLDEVNLCGARTRLVRFSPGAQTIGTLVHRYWEEVFVLSGDMYALNDPSPHGKAPLYSIRPPGTAHGPFSSQAGCMLFESQRFSK